jgi:TonB family protein
VNDIIWKLLINAAWQIPLCGAAAWCAARLLRRWPAVWAVAVWRIAITLAALLPLLATLPLPVPEGSGFQIPVSAIQAAAIPGPAPLPGTSWLALAYLVFVATRAIRLLRQHRALRKLSEETVATPVAFGWRKPQVILPARFTAQAPKPAMQAALAHETTHVRNGDFAHNLVLEFLTIPISFHPALFWIKRQTANAVELRCDEDAARETGNAREYALGLIEAARILGTPPSPRLTASFFDHNSFEERIMNLTQPKSQPRRGARLFAVVTLATAGLLLAGISTTFAAQQNGKVYKVGESGVKAPKVLHKTEPKYPEAATATGTTVLSLEVSPAGKAENIVVKRSLETAFDQSAIDSVKTWTFAPATKDGQPVRVTATVEVNFNRQ